MSHPNPHHDTSNSLKEDARGSGLLKPHKEKRYSLGQMMNMHTGKHFFKKFGLPDSIKNHPAKSLALNKAKA